ncbi:alpha-amylase [Ditylenchus destructor]|uniref:Alpha-amylase n=1 Tax=Ditylenchus destructor TaxID=166010 RepID=A0AAD4MTP6_9BILA|nr:alpha-amylase [Ditylenchus destructor]
MLKKGLQKTVSNLKSNVVLFRKTPDWFFALRNLLAANLDTTLPAGKYCNTYASDECSSDDFITVNNDGRASFTVPKRSIVTFTSKSKVFEDEAFPISERKAPSNRTVIFLYKKTAPGEHIHIRGGNVRAGSGCDIEPSASNKCSIPIVHETKIDVESDIKPSMVYSAYQQWNQGDSYLDFLGPEFRQGTHDGVGANGTPLIWTTNATSNPAFNSINAELKLGGHYWMVDLQMECNNTYNNFFEFKGFNGAWEPDISPSENTCMSGQPKSMGNNHVARCGAVNIFKWGVTNNNASVQLLIGGSTMIGGG